MSWAQLSWSSIGWLFAAHGRRTDRMGRPFQQDEALLSSELLLLIIAVLLLVAIIAWYVANWVQKRKELPFDSPRKLFRELCQAHNLTGGEQRLLADIATWHRLPNPIPLFLERQLFDAPALASTVGDRGAIESLKNTLFNEAPATDPDPGQDQTASNFWQRCRTFLVDLFTAD